MTNLSDTLKASVPDAEQLQAWRTQLGSSFPQIDSIFADCMVDAQAKLSTEGLDDYLAQARFLGKMGRGVEPVLIFLQEWPQIAHTVGEDALSPVIATAKLINKSPNGDAIAPFLQALTAVARRLPTRVQMQHFLDVSLRLMERTSTSIHGIHKTYPSPSLAIFFEKSPQLLKLLSLQGLQNWVDYGIRNTSHHPEQQRAYFSLASADSRAVLQRERHGTLLMDHTRALDLYLQALWQDADVLVPYSTAFDVQRQPMPYFDAMGIRLPDVYDERAGISGMDRYRAALAHIAAHRRWSTAIFGDNFSPAQRMAIECFEDSRIEALAVREYPGLRRIFRALHPSPVDGACNPATHSCLRHRLGMLSRALLDPPRRFEQVQLTDWVQRFHALLAQGESSTSEMAGLALSYLGKTRLQSDQLPNTWFADTEVDYRDDNRHLWRFHELSDDEDMFDAPDQTPSTQELQSLPPRHYPEWDYSSQSLRPDWVSLYERLHPSGHAADIDALLAKHSALAKRLKRLLDLLKPQDKVRVRYQEDGSELDLDVAIRSLIDLRAGSQPEPRINMSHTTNGRSIAVTLLLDLSQSLNEKARGTEQTVLQLSQEAVSLLAWSVGQLGDPLAIAGFHSNTRHDVRYLHLKGFGEAWGDEVKARLAAMQAAYSTRMGAAMRHAAHTLRAQPADKKLLLVLTDGQPSDIDVFDERLLIEDAKEAVRELDQQGIFTYCINLDAAADAYVSDIFGRRYTVIDNIARLPEQLPKLFMALTR
ncbi:nitric oxide reductase activation protein NorD [Rhodoferax sp.]|uniref:nitric oxide reductase activation protein NorD n=1 Tax=Rhodoferax sp. TaxID=50421 RepID=UPI002718224B|nr:VWA domain-containing protein [Rhodoferax sp.]MDO9143834.1 VWA domain-containing protein [Rhodoferax sp.]